MLTTGIQDSFGKMFKQKVFHILFCLSWAAIIADAGDQLII
jgi:hypothetical protein